MHVRLRTPDLTEELVRFLSRMGYRAHEVDYGVVAVDAAEGHDEEHLLGYLRIWQRVHARAAFEVEGEPAVWSLSRAETFALTAPNRTAAAAAYARYDELVPADARVGALFGPNDPVYPLHDAGLRRQVVYLSRANPVADAERRGLRIVVVGAGESAARFATAPGWRTRSLAGYWALVTREG